MNNKIDIPNSSWDGRDLEAAPPPPIERDEDLGEESIGESLKAPMREFDESLKDLKAKGTAWYSRATEAIESNPSIALIGFAGAAGILLGAGLLGKKVLFPRRETTLETMQSEMSEMLNGAAEILEKSSKKGGELAGDAAERSSEMKDAAADQLSSLSSWFKQSAGKIVDELPGEIERVSRRGAQEITRITKERPMTVGAAVATAALVAVGYTYLQKKPANSPSLKTARKSSRKTRGFEESSREELYAQAKARGIEGRSSMSKDELISALRSLKH